MAVAVAVTASGSARAFDSTVTNQLLSSAVTLLVCACGGLKQLSSVQVKCEESGETQAVTGCAFKLRRRQGCQRLRLAACASCSGGVQSEMYTALHSHHSTCVCSCVCAECVSSVLAAKWRRRSCRCPTQPTVS